MKNPATRNLRILAIDPGLANCGVCEIENGAVLDLAVYQTPSKVTFCDRLQELECDLAPHVLGAHVVAIETPSFPRSAVAAAGLWAVYGMVRGLARHTAVVRRISAPEWRRILGLSKHGVDEKKARKEATAVLMRRLFPESEGLLRGLPKAIHEHAYDALAIAGAYITLRDGEPDASETEEEDG